jgi:small-conductance mechanosensitive channel
MPTSGKAEANGEDSSLAERIARLERVQDTDKKRLQSLQKRLVEQEEEYKKASEEFKRVDARWEEQKKALQAAQESGDAAGSEKLPSAVTELEKKRKLARERFDLAIEARQTAQEQIQGFQEKIQKEKKALERLTKPADPAAAPKEPAAPEKPPPAVAATPLPPYGVPAQLATRPPEPPSAAKETAPPGASSGGETPTETVKASVIDPPENQEVEQARVEAADKAAAAKQAEDSVARIKKYLQSFEKIIDREEKALAIARKQANNEEETLKTHQEELRKLQEHGGTPAAVQALSRQIRDGQQRWEKARAEVEDHAAQLKELQDERNALLARKEASQGQAEQKLREAAAARDYLAALQSPFSPRNLLLWIETRGPKLLFILVVVVSVQILIKQIAKRIVALLSRGGTVESSREREKRAHTLVGVFRNTSIVVLYAWAALMTLEAVGIPIAPLLGGVAVVGLAVAFASQNLIKDYFYGFMILLENQYGVNDVISIAGITGLVERITLRITVIRDFNAVHFIPHGQITTVSNLTHKWSRAVFEIGIAYKENVDRVMELLMQLGRELRQDPAFYRDILDDPEMLGVDAFGDSAVVIKFLIKTKPLRQWVVKRELMRRIKNKFDELGIEIPFPHRTVYHRCEEGEGILVRQRERESEG